MLLCFQYVKELLFSLLQLNNVVIKQPNVSFCLRD
jgi:hypothetical protein